MMVETQPRILLTPGPLTTSRATKQAMLHDWGSRDTEFIDMTARVRTRLEEIAGAKGTHHCVPLQGSGTFAVEAVIGTMVPRDGKVLVLVNGAYGQRIARICDYTGRAWASCETAENVPPKGEQVTAALKSDPAFTHVAAVHCETTSGVLNPIGEIAEAVRRQGRRLIIDAMSSFGAIPLNAREVTFEAIVSSANKCLEGVPGVAFAVIERKALVAAEGNAPCLSFDLFDQWRYMERSGEWRFTPPTQVIAALDRALKEHEKEGGVEGRGARYQRNCRVLVDGMRAMGFETFVPDELQAPVIVTFHTPANTRFNFAAFYEGLRQRGIIIYPGKLSQTDSFRIGCIGHVDHRDMERALDAIRDVLNDLGVGKLRP